MAFTQAPKDTHSDIWTAINTKATDTAVVHTTGNETVAGTKTFSDAQGTFSGVVNSSKQFETVVTISGTTGTSSTPVTMPVIDPSLGNNFKAVLEYVNGVISFNMANLVQGQKFSVYIETTYGCHVAWDNALNIVWDNVYEPTIAESRGIFIADFIYMVDSAGNGKLHGKIIRNNKKSYADFPDYVKFWATSALTISNADTTSGSSLVNRKTWDGTLEYSLDDGTTWTAWVEDSSTNLLPSITSTNTDNSILFRGTGNSVITTGIIDSESTARTFRWVLATDNSTDEIYCYGRLDKLRDYTGTITAMGSYCYSHMFYKNTKLVTAPELPDTVLAAYCYESTFSTCSSLVIPPALPAKSIPTGVYYYTFAQCLSLEKFPVTIVTYSEISSFYRTFYGNSPKLYVSDVASPEYKNYFHYHPLYTGTKMFLGCSGTLTGECQALVNTPYYTSNEVVYPYDEVPTTLEERVETVEERTVDADATHAGIVTTGTQTFAGGKIFTDESIKIATTASNQSGLLIKSNLLSAKGTIPSASTYGIMRFSTNTAPSVRDDATCLGCFKSEVVTTSGNIETSMQAFKNATGSTKGYISVVYPYTGTPYGICPALTSGNHSKIATLLDITGSTSATTLAASASQSGVVTTGAQTFGGAKTFSYIDTSFLGRLSLKDTVNKKGVVGTNTFHTDVQFRDANNVITGVVYSDIQANGSNRCYISLVNPVYGATDSCQINLNWDVATTELDEESGETRVKTANAPYFKTPTHVPSANGTQDLGSSSLKWNNVYAVNGTIQTSDQRLKTDIENVPDEVLDAWGEVNWKRFKLLSSVQEKGDNARYHTGAIAQQIDSVFSSHGLDASKYGLFCHDSWEAKEAEYDEQEVIDTPAEYADVEVEISPAEYTTETIEDSPAVYEDVLVEDTPEVLDEEGNIITEAVTHTEHRLVSAAVTHTETICTKEREFKIEHQCVKEAVKHTERTLREPAREAGDAYSLRYEECLVMEAAYQRRRADRLEARIQAIESRLGI